MIFSQKSYANNNLHRIIEHLAAQVAQLALEWRYTTQGPDTILRVRCEYRITLPKYYSGVVTGGLSNTRPINTEARLTQIIVCACPPLYP